MADQNNFDAHVPAGTPLGKLTTAQKYNDIRSVNVEDIPTLRAKLQQRGYTHLQINGVLRFPLEYKWEFILERVSAKPNFGPIV